MTDRSKGSKLGAISSVLIIIVFFLPWARACNADLSGLDLATNSNGNVEDPWVYWLTLVAAIFCISLHFVVKRTDAATRIKVAIARLVAGIVGFFPLLNILYNARHGNLEILYGGYLTGLGYLGIGLSFLIDIFQPAPTRIENSTEPE